MCELGVLGELGWSTAGEGISLPGVSQFQRGAGPEHKKNQKKSFKIPSVAVFAIYILCRGLKIKLSSDWVK